MMWNLPYILLSEFFRPQNTLTGPQIKTKVSALINRGILDRKQNLSDLWFSQIPQNNSVPKKSCFN
jgi:hypothetical protein